MTYISKDTLWKGIIEDLFDDFLLYFFPDWAIQTVDFSKPFEFLDKELDEIYPKSKDNQKRYADKLVKVFTTEGKEQWILIHIEVQGYEDKNFPERMFDYFSRIRETQGKTIMAMVLLTDDNPKFHPKQYLYQYQNTQLTYKFETFKLLEKSEKDLNIANNPFSVVMLTARKALIKSNLSDSKQFTWKKDLVINLQQANYNNEKIRNLLNFIRYYVRFKKDNNLQALNQEIQTIFKQRKSMGIEEAILNEVREQGELQAKIKGIQKALKQNILNQAQIADLFEVSLDFILKVQKGELK